MLFSLVLDSVKLIKQECVDYCIHNWETSTAIIVFTAISHNWDIDVDLLSIQCHPTSPIHTSLLLCKRQLTMCLSSQHFMCVSDVCTYPHQPFMSVHIHMKVNFFGEHCRVWFSLTVWLQLESLSEILCWEQENRCLWSLDQVLY